MKEAYCTYETCKLLKEKGFDWDCDHYYKPNGEIVRTFHIEGSRHINSSVLYEHQCLAPTQQMAMRWLREMKNIDIEPFVYSNHHDGSKDYGCNIQENGHLLMTESFVQDTYEEAVEAALKYCLTELI